MLHLQITQVSLNQIAILFKPIWIADFLFSCSCCCRIIAQCTQSIAKRKKEEKSVTSYVQKFISISPLQFTMCHFWHSQCAAKQSTTFVVYLFRLHGSQHGRLFFSLVFFLSSISFARSLCWFTYNFFSVSFVYLLTDG